ncbi:MAG: CHAT domain-containing protein, partial [Vampirovibrionia bacterium]
KTIADASNKIYEEKAKNPEEQDSQKLEDLRTSLQQARQDFQKTALKLQQDYPDLLKYVAIKPTNIRTIQNQLPENTVIVEPIIIDSMENGKKTFKLITFIGFPGKNAPKYVKSDLGELDITLALVAFRKALYEKDDEKIKKISANLYDLLIKPIEKDIEPYEVLIISPYENLRYIPFQVLYDGEKYLIEKHAVVNATSSSGLKLSDHSDSKHNKLLAFGNATEDLPSSEDEVKTISSDFSAPDVFIRSNATLEKFNDKVYNSYDVIHLATHGILNNSEPENSALLFANKDMLSVGDIMAYDFSDKDLIVLSACDSVVGKTKGAEVSALGTAFELAAAPSVIASLWKVDDASTSLLMKSFYNYYTNGANKAEALRKAQLDLINNKKFQNPFYWAPFIILGRWY